MRAGRERRRRNGREALPFQWPTLGLGGGARKAKHAGFVTSTHQHMALSTNTQNIPPGLTEAPGDRLLPGTQPARSAIGSRLDLSPRQPAAVLAWLRIRRNSSSSSRNTDRGLKASSMATMPAIRAGERSGWPLRASNLTLTM